MMSHRAFAAALTACLIGIPSVATAVELNPKAIAIRQADELKWRDPTGAAPVNQVVLFGDPAKPGFYMVMNRFQPGSFSRPHFHPNDRFITVIKGTWYVGTGKVGQGRHHSRQGRRRGHPLRQGGALRWRQGRRGDRDHHRRGPGHQHAGRDRQMRRGAPFLMACLAFTPIAGEATASHAAHRPQVAHQPRILCGQTGCFEIPRGCYGEMRRTGKSVVAVVICDRK
jgi:hypothetical protein